jgi:hypothetical protein
VVVLQRIVEVVVLLAALRARRLSNPQYRLQQVLELHLLLLVLLLAVMAGVALNSVTHCVIPMVHMVVVARKQNTFTRVYASVLILLSDLMDTAVILMVTAWSPMDVSLAAKVRQQQTLLQHLQRCLRSFLPGLTRLLHQAQLVSLLYRQYLPRQVLLPQERSQRTERAVLRMTILSVVTGLRAVAARKIPLLNMFGPS